MALRGLTLDSDPWLPTLGPRQIKALCVRHFLMLGDVLFRSFTEPRLLCSLLLLLWPAHLAPRACPSPCLSRRRASPKFHRPSWPRREAAALQHRRNLRPSLSNRPRRQQQWPKVLLRSKPRQNPNRRPSRSQRRRRRRKSSSSRKKMKEKRRS